MTVPHRSPTPRSSRSWRPGALALLALVGVACNPESTAIQRPGGSPSFEANANWGQQGRLVDAALDFTTDRATIQGQMDTSVPGQFVARYAVQKWGITYTTVSTSDELVVASAAVYLPSDPATPLPMISLSHGTLYNKTNVPSKPGAANTEALGRASLGYVTVLADYLGMGADAEHFQPYLVAGVSASASLDALRAARRLVRQLGLSLDGRLFITGISQGGQVAMALAREIESDPRSGFRVTAAAPVSGPYNLYESTRTLLGRDLANFPSTTAFVQNVAAYQETYHLAERLDELLTPEAATVGERLMTLGMTAAQLMQALPPSVYAAPSTVMQSDAHDAVLNDPDAPFSRALRLNQTYDWRPTAPLRMYYGSADIDVSPENATFTEHWMVDVLHATDVQAVELVGPDGAPLDHTGVGVPSVIATQKWFDSFPVPAEAPDDPDENADYLSQRMSTQSSHVLASLAGHR